MYILQNVWPIHAIYRIDKFKVFRKLEQRVNIHLLMMSKIIDDIGEHLLLKIVMRKISH